MITVQSVTNHKWAGDAMNDGPMFNEIHEFVVDPINSVADKAEMLRVMSDKGMGCGRDEHISDSAMVIEYIQGI